MKLKLTRPLAFFDIETTGTNITTARIIEIAIIKLKPDGSRDVKNMRINPTIDIPAESTAIHGISNADIENAPTFAEVANELKQFLDNCDVAGYNSNKFDIPILVEEFLRLKVDIDIRSRKMVDVAQIFMKMEKRTLGAAYKFYCDKEIINAHSAEADTEATLDVLMAQLERYEGELEANVDFLHDFGKGEDYMDFSRRIKIVNDIPVFNFGKYKETSVITVFKKEPQYYDWIMRSDFAYDTKNAVTEIYTKMKL
jgi:DNA polymerase III subunit epsilon